MAVIGRALLILGLVVAVYGIGASIYGALSGRREWVDSGRRSVYALAGLTTAAFAILEAAFLRSDFSFNVVAGHSSTTTPTFYKLAAAWSSQEGSLLLWVFLLSVWSSLILFLTRRRAREIVPYATAVLLGFGAFFTSLAVFFANPFATSAQAPAEGAGLDPLLLHPSMMIHPPMLYSGYTLLTIPFAFEVGRANETVLTFNYSAKSVENGKEVGTSGSYSTLIEAADFVAENVTFENSAGDVGQAVALRTTGDRVAFRNCRFLGWQDTLYTHDG